MSEGTKRTLFAAIGALAIAPFIAAIIFLVNPMENERPPVPAPAPSPIPAPDNPAQNFGWLGPEAVKQAAPLIEGLPDFQLTGPVIARGPGDNKTLLWEAVKRVNGGEFTDCGPQAVGDCVSFGWSTAVEYLQAVSLTERGLNAGLQQVYPPFIYGVSRVQVGGGRINGDGSLGAWAAKAVNDYGVLSSSVDGCPRYSGRIARAWGETGPPQKFLDVADEFRVKTVSPIRTPRQAWDAITNGYPVPFCARYGPEGFDFRDGRYVAVGNAYWNHCQLLMAAVAVDGRRYFGVQNSWGDDWGPECPNNEPPGSYWIDWKTAAYILGQGDSFAISNFDGFKARDLNFNLITQGGEDERHDKRHGDLGGVGSTGRGRSGFDSRKPVAAPHPSGHRSAGRNVPSASRDGVAQEFRDGAGDFVRAVAGIAGGGSAAGRYGGWPGSLTADRGVVSVMPSRQTCCCGVECGCRDCRCRCGSAARGSALVGLPLSESGADVGALMRRCALPMVGGGVLAGECCEDVRGDLFGPDAETLKRLTDRAAERIVSEAVESIADNQTEIVTYGCAVAATGASVLAIVAACLLALFKLIALIVRAFRGRDDG